MFLRAIKKLTSENPCLLSLLDIKYFDDDPEFQMLAGKKQERSSQTLTHVLDSFRDPEYRWNEWEMRKEALKMANAKKMAGGAKAKHSRNKAANPDHKSTTWPTEMILAK